MNIELRKISYNSRLSDETNAYSAQVWVDGVHICDVSNHGHGAPDEHHPAKGKTHDDIEALNAAIIAERGTDKSHGIEIDIDLEIVCNELLERHLAGRDLARLLKRTVAFFDPAKKQVRSYPGKHAGLDRAHLITATLRQFPEAKILNNLPFDEALALYKKAG